MTAALPWSPGGWPVATLVANLTGAAVLSAFVTLRERRMTAPLSVDFWAIGLLGSLTTFSAMSLETVHLLDSDRGIVAIGYALTATAVGLVAAWAGRAMVTRR